MFLFILLSFLSKIENIYTHKEENVGLAWLKLPFSAKSASMGNTYLTTGDEPSSIWQNPACMVNIEDNYISITHNEYFQGIRHEIISLTRKLDKNYFGLGVTGLFIEGLEKRNERQELIGEYSAYNFSLCLSYARKLSKEFTCGFTLKGIYEKNYIYETSSWLLDLGFIYLFSRKLPIGGMIKNLGPKIKYENEKVIAPFCWKIGISYEINSLLFSFDVSKYIDAVMQFGLGIEYKITKIFSLMCGYLFNHDTQSYSFGFSIKFNKFIINYAYKPYKLNLGNTHIFTITI